MSNKELSQPTSEDHIDWKYHCKSCKRGFNADMAHQIIVRGPHIADIMCPWCKETYSYNPPEKTERPPSIVGTSISTEGGLTTARMFFKGGAWLQFRGTEEGRVYQEVFDQNGERINQLNAEIEPHDCDLSELYDKPETYLQRAKVEYEKYTVRGLKIHKPHVATALVSIP